MRLSGNSMVARPAPRKPSLQRVSWVEHNVCPTEIHSLHFLQWVECLRLPQINALYGTMSRTFLTRRAGRGSCSRQRNTNLQTHGEHSPKNCHMHSIYSARFSPLLSSRMYACTIRACEATYSATAKLSLW